MLEVGKDSEATRDSNCFIRHHLSPKALPRFILDTDDYSRKFIHQAAIVGCHEKVVKSTLQPKHLGRVMKTDV
jgi:hypothetical protein